MESFGPIVVSSVVANITMREFAGYQPPYEMPVFPTDHGRRSAAVRRCSGCCAARVAPHFLRLLAASKQRFRAAAAAVARAARARRLIVGMISVWWPRGLGQRLQRRQLAAAHAVDVDRARRSCSSFKIDRDAGDGGLGRGRRGLHADALRRRGARLRCSAIAAHALWPHATSAPFAYAMVGMGAFLAGATQAPLMAILMIFEMTLSYQVVLPLMLLVRGRVFRRAHRQDARCTKSRCAAREEQDERCGCAPRRCAS